MKHFDTKSEQPQLEELINSLEDTEFFHTPLGRAFAVVPRKNGCRETLAVETGQFREFLARRYYERYEKAIPSRVLDDAVINIAALAKFEGASRDVFRRVAVSNGAVSVDLGEQVAHVTAEGWTIAPSGDSPMIRPVGMLNIAAPVQNADDGCCRRFQGLFALLKSQIELLVVWMVCALQPNEPCPILQLRGEGREMLARAIRTILDPHSLAIRALPREERDLVIAASNCWLLALSVSRVPVWFSTTIRNFYTGAGLGGRRMYADDAEVTFQGRQPVIMAVGEEVSGLPPSLSEFTVSITLPPTELGLRRTEREVLQAVEDLGPEFLGLLLDLVSATLRTPQRRLQSLPRLPEFAIRGMVIEREMGWPPGEFLSSYLEARIAGAPVVARLAEFARSAPGWEGTATDLLRFVETYASPSERNADGWPSDPASFGKILRAYQGQLAEVGIQIKFGQAPGKTRDRLITLEVVE